MKLKVKKRGKDRIVHAGEAAQYMIKCKKNSIKPFDILTRFSVHREFKKYGISVRLKGRSRNTTTHLPRHIVAKSLKSAGMTIEESRKVLGQTSIKSTEFYHE